MHSRSEGAYRAPSDSVFVPIPTGFPMDFAICPACGQSVLDDDAVDCPFCGASMKSKPGSKPAAKPGAGKPAAKPAAKPEPKKTADDDLPFDPQTNLPQAVVAAAAAPSKGRPLKVVCPMCETAGYVPTSAAGKSVKCANPKCLVPVFTAPAPEPAAAPPPPPPKPRPNLLVLGLVTAVAVSALGGIAYMVALRPSNAPPSTEGLLTEEKLREIREKNKQASGGTSTGDTGATSAPDGQVKPETPVETPQGPTPATLIAAALDQANQKSLMSGNRNRSKPYCRRLSAEAYALAGNLAGARDQIDALSKVGQELPFYRVGPWVEVYWAAKAQGDATGAKTALDNALTDAAKLPKRGRDQLDVATKLAVALVVDGRDADARALIESHQAADLDGEVSAWLTWLAADRDLKQPEKLFGMRPVVPRQFPQAVAVAAVMTLKDEPDKAQKFARGWEALDVRVESLCGWAEALLWSQSASQADAALQAAVAELPSASAALVWARACRAAVAADQTETAKRCLTRAKAALEDVMPPPSYVIPAREVLVGSRPQFDDMHRRAAIAAAELAMAPASLGGDPAGHLQAALQYARGLGPSMPAIQAELAFVNRMSPNNLAALLKKELNLRTDDDARQARGLYQRALADLEEAAQRRFSLQTTILTRAAENGLAEPSWLIAGTRSVDADVNLQERYLETSVAAALMESFRDAKQADLEKAVLATVTSSGAARPERPMAAVYRELVAAGQYDKAWAAISRQGVKSDLQDALVLESAVRLGAKNPAEAWKLIAAVSNNVVLREQALEWAALLASRNGHAEAVSKHAASVTQATEMLSLYRGLVAGLRDSASEL